MKLAPLLHSLKFRIVAVAALTGVVAALGTATAVLKVTQDQVQHMLLDNARDDSEMRAEVLGSKLETLKRSVVAVARQVPPQTWNSSDAAATYLLDKPALASLFDSIAAVAPDGTKLARIDRGVVSKRTVNIADREYFKAALGGDQPVVSEAVIDRASLKPIVVIAMPALAPNGAARGVIVGAVKLESASLFASAERADRDGARDLVIERSGRIIAHSNPERVMGHAQDEPGLAEVFARWHRTGSPIDTVGSAVLSQGHLVSMAGIAESDWQLVRLTRQSAALAPLAAARRAAWPVALAAGALAALLAGAIAWVTTRPIEQLRDRAQRLLHDDDAASQPWPAGAGEIGEMSRAIQRLLQQRDTQRTESQALLGQVHAVLDNAEVGIALTREGHFELVSRQFCTIFGCEPAQAVGQPTRMIYTSDQAYADLSARAQPAFLLHGMFDGELELMRRGGQTFWAHMRGRAVVPGDRTQGTIWVITDITQAHQQHQQLSWAASHDKLTGLCNRAAFEAMLDEATAGAAEQPFCALFIDLDRFKQVNDTGGHAAGDALLRDIARELESRLRKSDTVARLGGDEFAVLLPQCPLPKARAIAESLRSAVDGYRLQWQGSSHGVGASIGLVAVNGTHANAAEVLRDADTACYQAKRQGRNQVAELV